MGKSLKKYAASKGPMSPKDFLKEDGTFSRLPVTIDRVVEKDSFDGDEKEPHLYVGFDQSLRLTASLARQVSEICGDDTDELPGKRFVLTGEYRSVKGKDVPVFVAEPFNENESA